MDSAYTGLSEMLLETRRPRSSSLADMLLEARARENRIDRETGLLSRAAGEFTTGLGDAALIAQTAAVLAGGDPSGVASRFAERNARKISPGQAALGDTKTFGEAIGTYIEYPSLLVEQPARSIGGALPTSIAAGAIGAAGGAAAGSAFPVVGNVAGGVIGGAIGAGSGSAALSGTLKFWERLQALGVDTADPKAIEQARGGPAWQQALSEAQRYGLTVGAFDAASAGAAGKIAAVGRGLIPVGAGASAARRVASEVVAQGVNMTAQGTLGGAGEAAGSVAAGQPVNPADVVGEFVGEFAGAPLELVSLQKAAALGRRMTGEKSRPSVKVPDADQTTDPAAVQVQEKARADIEALTQANIAAGMDEDAARERATSIVEQEVQQAEAQKAAEAEAIQQQARMALAEAEAAGTEAGSQGLNADDLTGIDPTLARAYMGAYRRARRAWERAGGQQSPPAAEPQPEATPAVEAQPEPASITTNQPATEPMPTVGVEPVAEPSTQEPTNGQEQGWQEVGRRQEVLTQEVGPAGVDPTPGAQTPPTPGADAPGGTGGTRATPLPPSARVYPDTPQPIADTMAEMLDAPEGASVLDPSAGRGALLAAVGRARPQTQRRGVEIDPTAAAEADPSVGAVLVGDSLTGQVEPADRVVVAPPFENVMPHLRRAWELTNPGGRMVALVPRNELRRIASELPISKRRLIGAKAMGPGQTPGAIVVLDKPSMAPPKELPRVESATPEPRSQPKIEDSGVSRRNDATVADAPATPNVAAATPGVAPRTTAAQAAASLKRVEETRGKVYARKMAQQWPTLATSAGIRDELHEYRVSGYVTRSDEGRYRLHPVAGTDARVWRLAAPIDVTDQYAPAATQAPADARPAPANQPKPRVVSVKLTALVNGKVKIRMEMADNLRRLVEEGTIRPATAEVLSDVLAQIPAAKIRRLRMDSGEVYNQRAGMTFRDDKDIRIRLKRGLGVMSDAADPDVTDAAVALEELGHAMWLDLPAEDQADVQAVYDELGEEGRAKFFESGIPDTQPGVKYAGSSVEEFFAHAFAEWVISRRLPSERVLSVFKRLGKRLLDAVRRVLTRDNNPAQKAVLDRLEPALKQAIGEGSPDRGKPKLRGKVLRIVPPREQSFRDFNRKVVEYAEEVRIMPDFEEKAYLADELYNENRVQTPNFLFRDEKMYRDAKETARIGAPTKAWQVKLAKTPEEKRMAKGSDFYLENSTEDWLMALIGERNNARLIADRVSREAPDLETVHAAMMIMQPKRPRAAVTQDVVRPGDELLIGARSFVVYQDGYGRLELRVSGRENVRLGWPEGFTILANLNGVIAGPEDNASFIAEPIAEDAYTPPPRREEPQQELSDFDMLPPGWGGKAQPEPAPQFDPNEDFVPAEWRNEAPQAQPEPEGERWSVGGSSPSGGQGTMFGAGGQPSMPEQQGAFSFRAPPKPTSTATAMDAVPNTPEMGQYAGVRVGGVLQFNPPKGQEYTVVGIRQDPERGVLLTMVRETGRYQADPTTSSIAELRKMYGETMQVVRRGGAVARTESADASDQAMGGVWSEAEKDRETGTMFGREVNDPGMTPQERAEALGRSNPQNRTDVAYSKNERRMLLQQAGLDYQTPGVVDAFMRGWEQSPQRKEYVAREAAKRESARAAYAKEFDPVENEEHREFAESVDWDVDAIRARFPEAATLNAKDPTNRDRLYSMEMGEDWLRMAPSERQRRIDDDLYEIREAERIEQDKREQQQAEDERKATIAQNVEDATRRVDALLAGSGLTVEKKYSRGSSVYYTIEDEESGELRTLRVSDHGPKIEYDRRGNPIVVGGFNEGTGQRFDESDAYIVVGETMPTNIEETVRRVVEELGGTLPQNAIDPAKGRADASVSESGGTAADRSDGTNVPQNPDKGNPSILFSRSPSTPAQVAAAAAIRDGKTSYAAVTVRVRRAIKAQDPKNQASRKAVAEARREALRIIRDAGEGGANLETAIVASQERARVKTTPKPGESVKATVQRTTGVAPADPEARRNLTANLRAQQRAASEAFKAGQQAERAAAEAPKRETLAQRIARVTGTKDVSPAVVTTQAAALRVALRREQRAATLAAREARKAAIDEMTVRLEAMRGKEKDRAKARRRAITIVKKLSPPANVKRYLSAIANARDEKSADGLITRVLSDLAAFRYRESRAEALAALKAAKPKKMREELRADVEQARKTLARIEKERADALAQVARIRERAAKTDARARYVERANARLTDKLNRLRGQMVQEVTQPARSARAEQRHWDEVTIDGRRMLRTEVVNDVLQRIAKVPALGVEGEVPTDKDASTIKRFFRAHANRDTVAAILGDGMLKKILVDDVRRGESAFFRLIERGYDARRKIIESVGLTWGGDEARRMSAKAEPKTAKLIDITLGGRELRLTEAELGEMYAIVTDTDARKRVLAGAGFKLKRTRLSDTTPVVLSRSDMALLERSPKLARIRKVVDALKADFQANVSPADRAAFRERFGYDMETWPGYWATRRENRNNDSDIPELNRNQMMEEWAKSGPKSLARTAMWKDRVEGMGDSPYIIDDVFSTHERMLRESAARINLEKTVTSLSAIVRDPVLRDAIRGKFGVGFHAHLGRLVEDSAIILRRDQDGGPLVRFVQGVQRNVSRAFLSVSPSATFKNVGGVGKLIAVMPSKYVMKALPEIASLESEKSPIYRRMIQGSAFLRDRHGQGAAVRAAAVLGETSDLLGPKTAMQTVKAREFGQAIDRLPFFAWGDSRASIVAWRAAELQVEAEQPALKGSAKTARVAEIAEDAIRATQNPHTLIDTDYARSRARGTLMAPIFMFTSDGITSLNMLVSSRLRYGVNSKQFAAAAAGVAINIAWAAAVTYMLRNGIPWLVAAAAGNLDEEEYRKGQQTAMQIFTRELLGNTAGLVYGGSMALEFGESIVNAATGKAQRPPDLALSPMTRVSSDFTASIAGAVVGVRKWFEAANEEDKQKAYERLTSATWKMIQAGTPLIGVPVVPMAAIARRSYAAAVGDIDPAKVHDDAAKLLQQPDPDIDRAARALALTLRGLPADQQSAEVDKALTALLRRGPDGRLSAEERAAAWRALPPAEREARAQAWREYRARAKRALQLAIKVSPD